MAMKRFQVSPECSPESCPLGVPLVSHRRCCACGMLVGCEGEQPAGTDWRLCADCEAEGKRLFVRGRRQKYLKPSEVAAELGLSRISVLRLIRGGSLPAVRLREPSSPNGLRYLVARDALKQWQAVNLVQLGSA